MNAKIELNETRKEIERILVDFGYCLEAKEGAILLCSQQGEEKDWIETEIISPPF